jgi:hypothetical protein
MVHWLVELTLPCSLRARANAIVGIGEIGPELYGRPQLIYAFSVKAVVNGHETHSNHLLPAERVP